MKFLVKPFGQHGFSMEGKFHYYLPLYEAFVMKWSALLGTMSLQEQQICGSEIMSERIKFLDFFLTSGYFFSLTVPFQESVICMEEISSKYRRVKYSPKLSAL